MSDYRVILLHGYNKDERDMYPLGELLEEEGFVVDYLNMPLTFGNMEESVYLLKELLCDLKNSGISQRDEIILIGHSVGGLVIRAALADRRMRRVVDRVVLISTPNNGCKLADMAGKYLPFLKKIYKPLKSLERKKFEELRLYSGKDIEVAAIAGSEPEMFLGRFLAEKNDGRVEVEEVKVKNLKDFLVLPLNHKAIHKKLGTAKYIANFIKRGSFRAD